MAEVLVALERAHHSETDGPMTRLSVKSPGRWQKHVDWRGDLDERDAVCMLRMLADAIEAELRRADG